MVRTCLLLLAPIVAGCGPLDRPLPDRLDPQSQKKVDEAWVRAFAPVNRLDHQSLLDVLIGGRVYQLGVDSLELRSEKQFAGGRAVMEVHYERAKPDQDRFIISIFDDAGKLLRSERFDRKDVEATYRTLHDHLPEGTEARAVQDARWNRILELLPAAMKR